MFELQMTLENAATVLRPYAANLDRDELRIRPKYGDSTSASECTDGWGNPLVYIHCSEYEKHKARVTLADGRTVVVGAKRERDGRFINPGTYQLFSLGHDGRPSDGEETDDDLCPTVRE